MRSNYDLQIYRSNAFEDRNLNDQNVIIPFDRNRVNLPPRMDPDKEKRLELFKFEVLNVVEKEMKFVKNNVHYKTIQKEIAVTKNFVKDNNLAIIPTDKTKKLCITNKNNYVEWSESILNDSCNYEVRKHSKVNAIENQANKMINSIFKNKLSKSNLEKLRVTGSQPANFYTLVKDHKDLKDSAYQMRPIASSINTPTNKIDWCCSRFLNQLVEFVPAHLKSSHQLVDILDHLNSSNNFTDHIFISLDVKNLYPSIPLRYGLEVVKEFCINHWDLIDNLNVTVDDLMRMLNFISQNYEIAFNEKIYLQKKGCPMGAQYAPAFAIIFMHSIETKALGILKDNYDIVPTVYKRYIDDVIMGPFSCNFDFDVITNVFNSVNKDIKFTIDVPESNYLNYLDLTIWINIKIHFCHYQKEIASGCTLTKDSWVPNHVKRNFIVNTFDSIDKRSSSNSLSVEAKAKTKSRLKRNGFSDRDFVIKKRSRKAKASNENKVVLNIDFISDSCSRKINYLIRKHKLNIRFVNKSNKKLCHLFRSKDRNIKHDNCVLCSKLPNYINCNVRFVVYQFICHFCSSSYIGKSSRPFRLRFNEHRRSIVNGDTASALADHCLKCAANNIEDFDVSILRILDCPVKTSISESQLIAQMKPALNRRHELASCF